MNDTIHIVIPGQPVPWARTRQRYKTPGIKPITPKRVRDWQDKARSYMRYGMEGMGPLEGPVWAGMTFVFRRPKSVREFPECRLWRAARPDRDNLEKNVMDAGNGIVWRDDCQVCAGPVEVVYGAVGEAPQVELLVRPIATRCRIPRKESSVGAGVETESRPPWPGPDRALSR